MTPTKRLAARFLKLPYHKKIEIALALNLIDREEDKGVNDKELFKRFFQRAKDRKLIPKLWEAVESHFADGEKSNPFTKKGNQ